MNKYLKYATRAIIIGLPTLLTIKSYTHLRTCRIGEKCGACGLSCLWVCMLFISAIAFYVFWIIENWDDIWYGE